MIVQAARIPNRTHRWNYVRRIDIWWCEIKATKFWRSQVLATIMVLHGWAGGVKETEWVRRATHKRSFIINGVDFFPMFVRRDNQVMSISLSSEWLYYISWKKCKATQKYNICILFRGDGRWVPFHFQIAYLWERTGDLKVAPSLVLQH